MKVPQSLQFHCPWSILRPACNAMNARNIVFSEKNTSKPDLEYSSKAYWLVACESAAAGPAIGLAGAFVIVRSYSLMRSWRGNQPAESGASSH